MKTILIGLMIMLLQSCNNVPSGDSPTFDPELAASLGADEYGNKSYILVILKTGPAVIEDPVLRDSLFAGHFSNMNRMAEAGQLVVAGPIGENNLAYRGIFILNTTSSGQAWEWLQGDPTITNQIFEAELFPWYGSAALPEHLKIHERIQQEKL
ncbi:MAG: hypothetical protein R6U64_02315 [Bacteroidales bacterium]